MVYGRQGGSEVAGPGYTMQLVRRGTLGRGICESCCTHAPASWRARARRSQAARRWRGPATRCSWFARNGAPEVFAAGCCTRRTVCASVLARTRRKPRQLGGGGARLHVHLVPRGTPARYSRRLLYSSHCLRQCLGARALEEAKAARRWRAHYTMHLAPRVTLGPEVFARGGATNCTCPACVLTLDSLGRSKRCTKVVRPNAAIVWFRGTRRRSIRS
jgi:hypothetical protein